MFRSAKTKLIEIISRFIIATIVHVKIQLDGSIKINYLRLQINGKILRVCTNEVTNTFQEGLSEVTSSFRTISCTHHTDLMFLLPHD